MGDAVGKRAFYKSPAFHLALAYLVACAIAVAWSGAHLRRVFWELWNHGRSWPFVAPERAHELWSEPATPWAVEMRAASNSIWLEVHRAEYFIELVKMGWRAALFIMPLLAALGGLARTVARARLRAGEVDPLARVRAFAKKHAALIFAAPALGLAYEVIGGVTSPQFDRVYLPSLAVAAPVVFLLHLLMSRLALRALLAPTLDESARVEEAEAFELSAVALTREAQFAVKGLAVVSVAMIATLFLLPDLDSVAVDLGVALYVLCALFLAFHFRRASRIEVGLDGIHVHGTSRSRFYPFAELDGVRASGSTIELLRGVNAALRLQLHGPDAARRDALVERLSAAVARAVEERDAPVTRFVNGATREDLARAAEGAGSYRDAAVSRDQLWAALESSAASPEARVAAAEALANSADASERARLRVATERFAEPLARARMQELIDHVEEEEESIAPLPVRRATLA